MAAEDKLAERAGDCESKFIQTITEARDTAEKKNDRKTVMRLVELHDATQDKIEDIDNERRQKVRDSQIWAFEQEIEVYGKAIEKVKALGCINERKCL